MENLDAPELKDKLTNLCEENIKVLQDLAKTNEKAIEALGKWSAILTFLLEGMKPSEFPDELQEELEFAYSIEAYMNPFKN